MGADLIFEWVAIKVGKERETENKLSKEIDKFVIPELSENVKVKIINSLSKEKSKEFKEFYGFWGDGLNMDFVNDYPTQEEIEDNIILEQGQARKYMKDVVKEFFDCVGDRDVSYLIHKGDRIYITGGMSWGDNPTDSLDKFRKFNCLPQSILNKCNVG